MTFNEVYKMFQEIDPACYRSTLEELANSVLPALIDISGERAGARYLSMFVLGAAIADEQLDEKEYDLLEPMFGSFFGEAANFAESKALVKAMAARGTLKTDVDRAVDFFGTLSPSLKADLVLICLIICAVDGTVSKSEKEWIQQLIK